MDESKSSHIKLNIGVDPKWGTWNEIKIFADEARINWIRGLDKNNSVSLQQARQMNQQLDKLLKDLHYIVQLRDDSW